MAFGLLQPYLNFIFIKIYLSIQWKMLFQFSEFLKPLEYIIYSDFHLLFLTTNIWLLLVEDFVSPACHLHRLADNGCRVPGTLDTELSEYCLP